MHEKFALGAKHVRVAIYFCYARKRQLSRENGKQTCMKIRLGGEARSRSNIFLLRKEKTAFQIKREANVHEKFALGGEARSRSNIFLLRKNILQGLVMVSTGIMQLEKRVARDALNSTIKIKR